MFIQEPTTWAELDAALWKCSIDPIAGAYRPYIAYRGLDEDYRNLKTGIQRIGGPKEDYSPAQLRWLERRIIDTFGTYASAELPSGATDWDVLLLGAHYRLPTRLLDWTASPYVALFFATEDSAKFDRAGIVWCVSRHKTNEVLPDSLRNPLTEQSGQMFTLETFRKSFPGLSQLDDSEEGLIWFEPPSVSPRIVNQYAFFSVMPGVHSSQSEWLTKHPELYWGVRVPAGLKAEVRRRLQVMNITERTIYTGLEGIARWLRAYYSDWVPNPGQ